MELAREPAPTELRDESKTANDPPHRIRDCRHAARGWLYRLVGVRMAASKPVATTRVVAAAKDIPLGAVLTSADLTTMTIAGAAPKGAILKPEDAIGRGAITQIYQGEPILESHLAGLGSGGGLAPTIPPRHASVRGEGGRSGGRSRIRDSRACAWTFWFPAIRRAKAAAEGVVTKTILQNIQVLSAGTDIQKDAEGKPQQVQVVNLLVTPEQAETLSLASNSLKIQLVLRNPLDTQIAKVPATAMSNLFGATAPPPAEHRRRHEEAPKPAAKHVFDSGHQRLQNH